MVPQAGTGSDVDGKPYSLGQRARNYRIRYRRGVLDESRVRELESRTGWSWDGYAGRSAAVWQRHALELRAHAAAHDGLDGLETVNPGLSRWLRAQRDAVLTKDQRMELADVAGALRTRKGRLPEFVGAAHQWVASESDRDAGDIRFSTVLTVGSTTVPLGRRAAYWRSRHAAGRLRPAEVEAIETLPGWRWEPPSHRRVGAAAATADGI